MLLEQAFRIMDQVDGRGKPLPFSVRWCTMDRKRKTGGEMKFLAKAVRCGAAHHMGRNRTISVKSADGKGHPYPIHLRLLMRINNEAVL